MLRCNSYWRLILSLHFPFLHPACNRTICFHVTSEALQSKCSFVCEISTAQQDYKVCTSSSVTAFLGKYMRTVLVIQDNPHVCLVCAVIMSRNPAMKWTVVSLSPSKICFLFLDVFSEGLTGMKGKFPVHSSWFSSSKAWTAQSLKRGRWRLCFDLQTPGCRIWNNSLIINQGEKNKGA